MISSRTVGKTTCIFDHMLSYIILRRMQEFVAPALCSTAFRAGCISGAWFYLCQIKMPVTNMKESILKPLKSQSEVHAPQLPLHAASSLASSPANFFFFFIIPSLMHSATSSGSVPRFRFSILSSPSIVSLATKL